MSTKQIKPTFQRSSSVSTPNRSPISRSNSSTPSRSQILSRSSSHSSVSSLSSFTPSHGRNPDFFNLENWAKLVWRQATRAEKFNRFCFNQSIFLILGVEIWILILFLCLDINALKSPDTIQVDMIIILVVFQLLAIVFLFAATFGMLKELQALFVRPIKIWNMYLCTSIIFGAIYFTLFCLSRDTFNLDGYSPDASDDNDDGSNPDAATTNKVVDVFIYFVYFSASIMTSTGFGDITPLFWYSQMFANMQMVVGTVYHVGVFGLTLAHFRQFQKMSEEEKKRREERAAQEGRSALEFAMDVVSKLRIAKRLRNISPVFDTIRKFCLKYLAFVTIGFQIIITSLLFFVTDPFQPLSDKDGTAYYTKLTVIIIMVVLQTFSFLGIMLVSIRLVKNISNSEKLTASFLLQSYIATVLLFGGLYFIVFVATPHHQFSSHVAFSRSVMEVLYMFVHFSFTVMTTTGFGDVYARGVLARIFVVVQMFVSILYNAVIIGLGTSQLIDMQADTAEKEFEKMKEQVISADQSVSEGEMEGGELEDIEEGLEISGPAGILTTVSIPQSKDFGVGPENSMESSVSKGQGIFERIQGKLEARRKGYMRANSEDPEDDIELMPTPSQDAQENSDINPSHENDYAIDESRGPDVEVSSSVEELKYDYEDVSESEN